MRETGTQISHNPSSNAKLGNGVARLPEMLAAGINVGIGHDAAECNNSRDLFEVMKFASLIHRATRVDAALQQPGDVLRMATRNGARALGHDTGQLGAGQEGRRHPRRPAEPVLHAAPARQQGPPLLAPGVRGQRQLRRHHDRGRPDRDAPPRAADHRRAQGARRGQRRLRLRRRADGGPGRLTNPGVRPPAGRWRCRCSPARPAGRTTARTGRGARRRPPDRVRPNGAPAR